MLDELGFRNHCLGDADAGVRVPDNASTASNQISSTSRARDVNPVYAGFLEYHQAAAVPARAYRPRDKGNVEAGVKVVGRSSELVRLVHPVGTQFRRPGTVSRFRVF